MATILICPVGDTYGTVKSHAHGMLGGYQFATQEEEDEVLADITPVYVEVSPQEWVLFAINARSANVTGDVGSFGYHTLWRSSRPRAAFDTYGGPDTNVGKESSPVTVNTGEFPRLNDGDLIFNPLPWILAATFELDAPAPETGYPTPFLVPACYILEGKFFIGVWSSGGGPVQRVEVSDRTLSHFRNPYGTELRIDFEITSTFYPT